MIEFEAPDWRALHSSLARRRRFAFCPVGYYLYHVPGRDGYANHAAEWHYLLYAAKHHVRKDTWIKEFFRSEIKKFFGFSSNFRRGRFDVVLRRNFEQQFSRLENGEFLSDPKNVYAIIEVESGTLTLSDFYEEALLKINDMSCKFMQSIFWEELQRLPQSNFSYGNSSFYWQLGGVNFAQVPDLVWRNGNNLRILDMNFYAYEQERRRRGELFRVYCWRFLHIAPEKIQVINYDPQSGDHEPAARSDEDFAQVFLQLSAEAAMWRDYLVKQYSLARSGEWLYAQYDKCAYCRFNELCPARNGTAEIENNSIFNTH